MASEASPQSPNAFEMEITRAAGVVLQAYLGQQLETTDIADISSQIADEARLSLIGVIGAAQILKVTPQRVRQLTQAGKMPPVAGTIDAGRRAVWLQCTVEELAQVREPMRQAFAYAQSLVSEAPPEV